MEYKILNTKQINQLESQGCAAADWKKIFFSNTGCLDRFRNVNFSGKVNVGTFDNEIVSYGEVKRKTGIYDATLHNCTIGNNVFIRGVNNYIANYIIEDEVQIENVNILATEGFSCFGNGTLVEVINEGAGRLILIYDKLSAHLAYILALYRHRSVVIEKLNEMIEKYKKSIRSEFGQIGKAAQIRNCDIIKDVKIGSNAVLEGVLKLKNGSINSNKDAPVYVGSAVIATDFIISSGSEVNNATQLSHCFVGQGCILDKHYSAVHSVFFANCQGFHGEACSIFAGPYTVSHHKSSLLIAGLFSFMNAGSGSNQSNHMYKLGPIHQGVVERGSKTTSDSYILWPAKIGAFTLVMGRHYKNSDTSNLPFSYLIENKDESVLAPGVNLRSVGTVRDAQKFPRRDRRKDKEILDFINYNLLSPYTIHKMLKGREILFKLKDVSGELTDDYAYRGLKISKKSLLRGIKLYEIAIHKFLGNSLISRLGKGEYKSNEAIRAVLKVDSKTGKGKWIDMVGLICPLELLIELLDNIENGRIKTLTEVNKIFKTWHENYYSYEWTWAVDTMERFYNKKIADFTAEDVIEIVEKWKESVIGLDKMLYEDARKEFSLSTQVGFGVDGKEQERRLDFAKVRGDFKTNKTVVEITQHIQKKEELGNNIIKKMKKVIFQRNKN